MNILKQNGETLKEYKIRLFRNKDSYKLSNKDIAELINNASNLNRDESSYRKWFAAYEEGYTDGTQYSIDNSAILNKLTEQRIEAEKAKKKAQTERIETNKWIREQARSEMFYDKVQDCMAECLSYNPVFERPSEHIINNNQSAVLFLADQHYGVSFTINGLDGSVINQYSPEIFEERMNTILWETVDYINKNDIKHLDIMCLGDSLDGLIRQSQLIKLRWGVIDCAVKYANYMFNWFTEISKYIDITIYNVAGNHTRLDLLGTKKGEHERENLDKVIMSIIKNGVELTNNDRITIVENYADMIYTELNCGTKILGIHGEVKNLDEARKDYQEAYNIDIDYIVAGHLHHNEIMQSGYRKGAIRVGSIIGVDSFSMKVRKCADATANIGVFEKDKGLVDLHTIILN